MLALQDWFRSEFQYSLDVPAGPQHERHRGVPAPAHRLLRAVRRHVRGDGPLASAIPARVAVGYTPGLLQPDGTRSGARQERPRLAGDLVRRSRLGAVRADARARRAGRRDATPAWRRPRTSRHPAPATATGGGAGAEAPPVDVAAGRSRSSRSSSPSRDRRPTRPTGPVLLDDACPTARVELARRRHRARSSLGARAGAAGDRAPLAPGPPERRRGPPDDRAVATGARRGRGDRVPRRPVADAARAGPRRSRRACRSRPGR